MKSKRRSRKAAARSRERQATARSTPAKLRQRPIWRIDLIEVPGSAIKLLLKLKFRNERGCWSRPVWTRKQGAFLIEKVKAAGCHGRPVLLSAEMARHREAVDRIVELKKERVCANASKRAQQLENAEIQRLATDALKRAMHVVAVGGRT